MGDYLDFEKVKLIKGDCIRFYLETNTMIIFRPDGINTKIFKRNGDDKLLIAVDGIYTAKKVATGIAFSTGLRATEISPNYCGKGDEISFKLI